VRRTRARTRPRILLDVDGPLTDGFTAAVCKELRRMNYAHAREEDVTDHWDMFGQFAVREADVPVVRERLRRPGVATSFEPRAGAKEFLTDLRKWACVLAVTAPLDGSATWAHEREVWLIERLGFDPLDVIQCRSKGPVQGDAFCDDKHSNVHLWAEENPESLAILWGVHAPKWKGPRAADYEALAGYLEALRVGGGSR